MASVVRRTVKGKRYHYLEQNVRIGKRFKKFYQYLGQAKPAKRLLREAGKRLTQKVHSFYRHELIKPNTQFVDLSLAKSLERIKQETAAFLDGLNERQKKAFIEREREKFITHTNAIEGSTLTLEETHRILRLRERLGSERERLEVLNMEKCLHRYDELLKTAHPLNEDLVLQLHAILLNKIPDYDQFKGMWRPIRIKVRTSHYAFPHPLLVPSQMKEFLDWFNENTARIHPVELAAAFHCKLTTIHPFADGNGRMARLLMNYLLQTSGFPFTNIPVEKRDEYFDTQEEGHQRNYGAFTLFLANQLKENYKTLKKNKEWGVDIT